jgi:hypothetical protein
MGSFFSQMFALLAKAAAPAAPTYSDANMYDGLDGSVCPQYTATVQSLTCKINVAN